MSHTTLVKAVQIRSESALRQMAKRLAEQGLNVELVQNAAPRMYYRNQIQRTMKSKGVEMQYHSNVEECDFVLNVKDAYYDIGFLKDKCGNYIPIFDGFEYPAPHLVGTPLKGSKPLKALVGKPVPIGTTDSEKAPYCIGKVLQEYSLCAAIEACVDAGYSVLSSTLDETGEVVLEVEVI